MENSDQYNKLETANHNDGRVQDLENKIRLLAGEIEKQLRLHEEKEDKISRLKNTYIFIHINYF